jgi:membrane protease subunit HflK
VIAEAEGDVSRFLAILNEYRREPTVTRERLYLDAIESMLGQSSKVMLDTQGGNSLMYLPLDKLIQGDNKGRAVIQQQFTTQETSRTQNSDRQIRNVDRTREGR